MAILPRLTPLNGAATPTQNKPYVDDIFDPLFNKEITQYYNSLYGNPVFGTANAYLDLLDNTLTGNKGILGPGMGMLSTFGRSMDKFADPIIGTLTESVNALGNVIGGTNPAPKNPFHEIFVNDYDYTGVGLQAAATNAIAKLANSNHRFTENDFTSLPERISGGFLDLALDPGVGGSILSKAVPGSALQTVGDFLTSYDDFTTKIALDATAPGVRQLARSVLNKFHDITGAASSKDLEDIVLEAREPIDVLTYYADYNLWDPPSDDISTTIDILNNSKVNSYNMSTPKPKIIDSLEKLPAKEYAKRSPITITPKVPENLISDIGEDYQRLIGAHPEFNRTVNPEKYANFNNRVDALSEEVLNFDSTRHSKKELDEFVNKISEDLNTLLVDTYGEESAKSIFESKNHILNEGDTTTLESLSLILDNISRAHMPQNIPGNLKLTFDYDKYYYDVKDALGIDEQLQKLRKTLQDAGKDELWSKLFTQETFIDMPIAKNIYTVANNDTYNDVFKGSMAILDQYAPNEAKQKFIDLANSANSLDINKTTKSVNHRIQLINENAQKEFKNTRATLRKSILKYRPKKLPKSNIYNSILEPILNVRKSFKYTNANLPTDLSELNHLYKDYVMNMTHAMFTVRDNMRNSKNISKIVSLRINDILNDMSEVLSKVIDNGAELPSYTLYNKYKTTLFDPVVEGTRQINIARNSLADISLKDLILMYNKDPEAVLDFIDTDLRPFMITSTAVTDPIIVPFSDILRGKTPILGSERYLTKNSVAPEFLINDSYENFITKFTSPEHYRNEEYSDLLKMHFYSSSRSGYSPLKTISYYADAENPRLIVKNTDPTRKTKNPNNFVTSEFPDPSKFKSDDDVRNAGSGYHSLVDALLSYELDTKLGSRRVGALGADMPMYKRTGLVPMILDNKNVLKNTPEGRALIEFATKMDENLSRVMLDVYAPSDFENRFYKEISKHPYAYNYGFSARDAFTQDSLRKMTLPSYLDLAQRPYVKVYAKDGSTYSAKKALAESSQIMSSIEELFKNSSNKTHTIPKMFSNIKNKLIDLFTKLDASTALDVPNDIIYQADELSNLIDGLGTSLTDSTLVNSVKEFTDAYAILKKAKVSAEELAEISKLGSMPLSQAPLDTILKRLYEVSSTATPKQNAEILPVIKKLSDLKNNTIENKITSLKNIITNALDPEKYITSKWLEKYRQNKNHIVLKDMFNTSVFDTKSKNIADNGYFTIFSDFIDRTSLPPSEINVLRFGSRKEKTYFSMYEHAVTTSAKNRSAGFERGALRLEKSKELTQRAEELKKSPNYIKRSKEYFKYLDDISEISVKKDDIINHLLGSGGKVIFTSLKKDISRSELASVMRTLNNNINKIENAVGSELFEIIKHNSETKVSVGYRFKTNDLDIKRKIIKANNLIKSGKLDLEDIVFKKANPSKVELPLGLEDIDSFFKELRMFSEDLSTKLGHTDFDPNYIKHTIIEDPIVAQNWYGRSTALGIDSKTDGELTSIVNSLKNENAVSRGALGTFDAKRSNLGTFEAYSDYFTQDPIKILESTLSEGTLDNVHAQTFFELFLSDNLKISQNFKDVTMLKNTLFNLNGAEQLSGNLTNTAIVSPKYNAEGRLIGFKKYNKFNESSLTEALKDDTAVLLPNSVIGPLDNLCKKDVRLSNKFYSFINKYFTLPFKFGTLTNAGFLVGNLSDAVFKQATTLAKKYNTSMAEELANVAMSMKKATVFNNRVADVVDDFRKYVKKQSERNLEYAKILHMPITSESVISNKYVYNLWKKYVDHTLKGDARDIARAHMFINTYNPSTIFNRTFKDLELDVDKNFYNKYDKPNNIVERVFYGDTSKPESKMSSWGLFFNNPVSRTILNGSEHVEQLVRLSSMINDLERRGILFENLIPSFKKITSTDSIEYKNLVIDISNAVNTMAEANFDYDNVSSLMGKLSYILPFPTFYLKNLSYWLEVLVEKPQMIDNIISMQEAMWEGKDISSDFEAEAKGRGAFPIGIGNDHLTGIVKQSPYNSMFGAFNTINNFKDDFLYRLNPLTRTVTHHLQDDQDVRYRPYNFDPYQKNIVKGSKDFSSLEYLFHQLNPQERSINTFTRTPGKLLRGTAQLSDFVPSVFQPIFKNNKKE